MKVVGLTGSIGSGKSTVARILAEQGAMIIDADILARDAVAPGTPGHAAIVEHFSDFVLTPEGSIDRAKLGRVVFDNAAERKKLEAIVHPLVRELFRQRLSEIGATSRDALVIAVIPLLFESNNPYPEIQTTIVVYSSDEQCIQRIIDRDGCSREFAQRKLAAQMPQSEKRKRATYSIENNSTLDALREKTLDIYYRISL